MRKVQIPWNFKILLIFCFHPTAQTASASSLVSSAFIFHHIQKWQMLSFINNQLKCSYSRPATEINRCASDYDKQCLWCIYPLSHYANQTDLVLLVILCVGAVSQQVEYVLKRIVFLKKTSILKMCFSSIYSWYFNSLVPVLRPSYRSTLALASVKCLVVLWRLHTHICASFTL